MKTTRVRLDGEWQVQQLFPAEMNPALHLPPLPAEVPGYVHLDLQRAGVVPDPFDRLYERTVAWVDDTDWVYETTFRLDSIPEGALFLHFLGLDTIAEIALNGRPLGRTDNMFIDHEFDVRPFVRIGENTLTITLRSARCVGRERLATWSDQHETPLVDSFLWDARSFVRKSQYMFGWDWGPILISCGIWRPVELVHVPIARILDWRYDVSFGAGRAMVRLQATVERTAGTGDTPLTLTATIGGAESTRAEVPPGVGELRVTVEIPIEDPRRWSPDTPALYPFELQLCSGETVLDTRQARMGLRTIELLREPDPAGGGESFLFLVNGEPLFCKGANCIPADSFPSRSYDDPHRLRPLLEAAKEAGCNMLRVWGGGMYESDTFYDLCDELGLLVWQDFPYACAYYPDDAASLQVAADEARAAVRRVRVHPSLALWCGNNENSPMFVDNWHALNPPRFLGEAWNTCLAPADRTPSSPAVRWHDKTAKPYDVYLGYIERHFPPVRSLEDLVYYSQLNQAEAMKCGVEHYRRIKGRCWGTLIWQLNDCWPVQSWAMIDYLGEHKAVHYAAKHFYAPVLLSVVQQPDRLEFHLTNDLLRPISGRLTLQLMYFDGTVLREEDITVALEANCAGRVARLSMSDLRADPRDIYLNAILRSDDPSVQAEAVFFLTEPKDLCLPVPQLQTMINETAEGLIVTLEAAQFAAYVWLAAPGLPLLAWSDNFFHIVPGEARTVAVTSREPVSAENLRERLTLRTLNEAVSPLVGEV